MSAIAALLEASSLRHAPDALAALRDGWVEGRHSQCDIADVRRIYTLRLDGARQSDSGSLKDLSVATAEMLDNLRSTSALSSCAISSPDGRSFVVFYSPTEGRILGCLRTAPNPDSAANLVWANGG
jgi:hypothetical protein